MKIYIKKCGEILFFIGIYIEIFLMCSASTGWEVPMRGRIFQLAAGLFGLKILCTHYSLKEYAVGALTAALALLQWRYGADETAFYVVLMVFASKDIPVKRLWKQMFWILSVFMAGMVIASCLGWIDGLALIKDYGRGRGVETRYCFGYPHPNVFHSNLLTVFCVGTMAYGKEWKAKWIGFVLVLNIVVSFFTVSRNGTIVILILCILTTVTVYKEEIWRKTSVPVMGMLGILSCMVFSLVVVAWKNPITDFVDVLISNRIMLARQLAPFSTWTILPNAIYRDVLDMGYIKMCATWGLLLSAVYMIYMLVAFRRCCQKELYLAASVIATYAIFTIVEGHATSMYFIGNVIYVAMLNNIFGNIMDKSGKCSEQMHIFIGNEHTKEVCDGGEI